MLNATEIKQQVSLSGLLSNLGYEPAKKSGKELFYRSMLRDTDLNPSFCVNEELGVWFDHGMGKGGNVVDFGIAFWKQLSFPEVLEKISISAALKPDGNIVDFSPENYRRRRAIKLPHYKIEDTRELGNNSAITNYLNSRGIYGLGKGLLKELYYYVEDEKKTKKHFFAAGWPNENGGWDVRNLYFKGCLGPKGMTQVEGNPERIIVFEGMMNYLSWKFEHEDENPTALIMNSIAFLSAATKRCKGFSEVVIFFDHDDAGEKATAQILADIPQATDGSIAYTGYNDYNDKLVAEIDNLCQRTSGFRR